MQVQFDKTYVAPSSCGAPWGITLDDELRSQSKLNASFSQEAWTNSMLNGCQPKPCMPTPEFPPPPHQFIYPQLQTKSQEILDLGLRTGCPNLYEQQVPYATPSNQYFRPPPSGPVIDTVNPSQCPPGGMNVSSVPNSSIPPGADPELANRLASRILGLPMPSTPSWSNPSPSTRHEMANYRDDPTPPSPSPSPSPTPPPPPPSPTPAPSPYDKPECQVHDPQFSLKQVLPCSWNTLEGVMYDLQHWKDLPVTGTWSKIKYIFSRDDRLFYLGGILVTVLILVVVLKSLLGGGGGGQKEIVRYIPVPATTMPASH
jgi:hypothetical protein